jgi:hypothetical protein
MCHRRTDHHRRCCRCHRRRCSPSWWCHRCQSGLVGQVPPRKRPPPLIRRSQLLSSLNAYRFFDITVDSSASSSSTYLSLFSLEAIGLLHRMESSRLRKVSAFRFILSRRWPFQWGMHDYSMMRWGTWTPSSNEKWLHQHRPSLMWSLVATGVADVSFRPSLLSSWVTDVKTARSYYSTWSLLWRAELGLLLQ